MTVQELIDLTKLMYPNAHTNAELVSFMNVAQNELSPYFGLVVEDNTLVTVADQDSYSFPTGLTDVAQILSLGVGIQATPDTRYGYVKYDIITRDDYPVGSCVYFQTVDENGAKKLVLQPTPSVDGLPIRIRFRKALTALSTTVFTGSPDFDSRFHSILADYAAYMVCSTGASPDTIQADAFMQKYLTAKQELWRFKLQQEVEAPTFRMDNRHWRGGRRHAGN